MTRGRAEGEDRRGRERDGWDGVREHLMRRRKPILAGLLGDVHVIHYETLDENQLVLVQEEKQEETREE